MRNPLFLSERAVKIGFEFHTNNNTDVYWTVEAIEASAVTALSSNGTRRKFAGNTLVGFGRPVSGSPYSKKRL